MSEDIKNTPEIQNEENNLAAESMKKEQEVKEQNAVALKKEKEQVRKDYEKFYKNKLGGKPLDMDEKQRFVMDLQATRHILEKGAHENAVGSVLVQLARHKDREIESPTKYANNVLEKSIEFNKQKGRDIKVATQIGNQFCSPENIAENRKKIEFIIEKSSRNMRRFSNDAIGKEDRSNYVQSIVNRSVSLSLDHHERYKRWQGIQKPPMENAERDPVKAYQISAHLPRKSGKKDITLDIAAGEKMAKDGYTKEQIEKAFNEASPLAVGRKAEHSKAVFKRLENTVEFSKNQSKEKSRQTGKSR